MDIAEVMLAALWATGLTLTLVLALALALSREDEPPRQGRGA